MPALTPVSTHWRAPAIKGPASAGRYGVKQNCDAGMGNSALHGSITIVRPYGYVNAVYRGHAVFIVRGLEDVPLAGCVCRCHTDAELRWSKDRA